MPRRRPPEPGGARRPGSARPKAAGRRKKGKRSGGSALLVVGPAFAIATAGLLVLESLRGDASVVSRAARQASAQWDQGDAERFQDAVARALDAIGEGVLVTRESRGGSTYWTVTRTTRDEADLTADVDRRLRDVALQEDAAIWLYRPRGQARRYELFARAGASAVVHVVVAPPAPAAEAAPRRGSLAATEFEEQVPPDAAPVPRHEEPPVAVATTPTRMPPHRRGPVCAIIIDDLGDHPELLPVALALDFPVTYAVIPFLPHSRGCADTMRDAGKEVMIHLPMEPLSFPRHDPGQMALFRGMDAAEVDRLTREAIADIPGARGVNNHMGSAATRDGALMRRALAVVKQRGLYFVDSRTASDSVALRVAQELGIPSAARHVFLDREDFDADFTQRQLRTLVDLARTQGRAIGIGHWHESTLRVLGEAPALAGDDVTFVFASEMVQP